MAQNSSAFDHSLRRGLFHPKHWLTWFSLFLLAVLAWFPVKIRDGLAHLFVNAVIRFSKKQCYVARMNLKICFPDKTDAEIETLLRQSIDVGLKGFFALAEPTFLPPKLFMKRMHIDGQEYLEAALATGKPVIVMVPHTWTIDACGLYFSYSGLHFCTMMHSARNPVYDWFLNKQRTRFGGNVYERSAGLKPIIKDMKNGFHFFYLPDQDHGHEASVFVPLFNEPKATLPALPKLAKLSNAVVLPVLATYNTRLYRYEIKIRPAMSPYPTDNLLNDVAYMNQEIEALLSEQPEQYMWFLKYFRSMPDGTERNYNIPKNKI